MSKHRPPAARLLIVPAVLLGILIVGLHGVASLTERQVDDSLSVLADVPKPRVDPAVPCDPAHELADRVRDDPEIEYRITSDQVYDCPIAYDGAKVRYVGEIVGDILPRSEGVWALVNDDDYALEVGPLPTHGDLRGTNSGLAVWLPEGMQDALTAPGRPGVRGDIIEVEGHIARTDSEDGGGLTLRATSLTVVAPAARVHEPVDRPQLILAGAMVALFAGLWEARRRAAKR